MHNRRYDRQSRETLYDFSLALERIAAAAQAARILSFPFILTARAHNFMYANPSLHHTIKLLQAFERAGADVLFAPGLPDIHAVRAVCTAVSKPVNFMVGIKGKSFSVALVELTYRWRPAQATIAIEAVLVLLCYK